MAQLTIDNAFSPGTTALSAFVNQNFADIVTWSTTIDESNIGPIGIYPSQLIPTTAAQATFGGITAGVGYKFLATSIGAVPLTVSGVSGQNVDIQQWTATSGGTKALFVDKAGVLGFGALGLAGSALQAYITADQQAVIGMLFNVPSASTSGFRFFTASNNLVAQITAGGGIIAGATTAAAISAGDIFASRSVSTGIVKFGGSTSNGGIDWNIVTPSQISLTLGTGAFAPFSAGAYTNASDISLKKNIAAISDSLGLISQLKPSSFIWIEDDSNDIGFVAQDIAAIMPDAITTFADGTLGYKPVAILAHLVAAFQQYVSDHP